jgi:hypothetical protein
MERKDGGTLPGKRQWHENESAEGVPSKDAFEEARRVAMMSVEGRNFLEINASGDYP